MSFIRKNLPASLTSYDLLKALAIVLMIIDHIGFYFYPEDMWFRIFGRLCVPIWFFLIGYAKTREIPGLLWIGAGLLAASTLIAGQTLFPLPILITLAAARFMIDPLMARALRSPETLAGMYCLLVLLSVHSAALLEYGTLGLLLAMYGYICRHREQIALGKWLLHVFIMAVALAFVGHQILLMPALDALQLQVFLGGTALIFILLYAFRPREYPGFSRYGRVFLPVFQIAGRWTLEIYVIHLLFFRGLSMVLDPERFGFLQFDIIPPGMMPLFL